MKLKILLACLLLLAGFRLYGQTITISGKVTDATTGEGIPFANVVFKNLHIGASTNFEGFYQFKTDRVEDSLTAIYLGYSSRSKRVVPGKNQVINFQLEPTVIQTQEVIIHPGENPAWRILRGVWANKDKHDKRSLSAYQYESYTKIEVDADNIDKKFIHSKAMKPFQNIFNELKLQAGEDGKPILPIFISESISDFYYLRSPERKKEDIKATHLTGVGLEDGSVVSQLVGSSFQDYNFYQNWLNLLEKNFMSPIADGGLGFYRYYLVDSLVMDGRYCYKIDFKPKRKQDLAFHGTMWITDTTFALKRINVEIGKAANLNFIDKLKIQQDLSPTSAGAWMPAKTRVLLQISRFSDQGFGMLAKMYVSTSNVKVNEEKPLKFYEDRLTIDPEAQQKGDTFWDTHRHDSLTVEDKRVMHLIDTVRNMPKVKTYIEVADVIVNGYYKLGKYDIGPYLLLYGYNIEEGSRFRIGFRTNYDFSNRWILKGYAAVGTNDWYRNGLKYMGQVQYFLSRKNWTKVGVQREFDIEGLGVEDEFFSNNNLLQAGTQTGQVTKFNLVELNRVWFESDIGRGFNQRVYLLTKNCYPRGRFNFEYFPHPEVDRTNVMSNYRTTELTLETRYAYKEAYIINDNRRARIGVDRSPIFTANYTLGIPNFLGGQFLYHKASLKIEQQVKEGAFGRGKYAIIGTKVFNPLPYPLLSIVPGNQTFVRADNTFNLMGFFEFVTDESVKAFYTQHFDGLFFNRIPLLRRLKLREVAEVGAVWGSLKPENDITGKFYPDNSQDITHFKKLDPHIPYVEVGYGVENIFKFIRVDAFHRLNYLQNNAPKFGVRVSLYFAF